MSQYKVGADIEVFLCQPNNEEKYVSVVGLLGGTKDEPKKLNRKGCFVQEDNVAAEFNVSPTTDPEHMWQDIQYNIEYIQEKTQYPVKVIASAQFPEEELLTEQAKVFGCEPDINAWDEALIIVSDEVKEKYPLLRTTGGHIHIGYDLFAKDNDACFEAVKLLDFYLGIPSLLLDTDTDRRILYGVAGACRLKPYGLEYRSLSSFWCSSKELVEWVFEGVERVMNDVREGRTINDLLRGTDINVENIINSYDKETAQAIVEEFALIPETVKINA